MSQHHFRTTCANRPVLVIIGWDRPLSEYFMSVQRLGVTDPLGQDRFLFNKLSHEIDHPERLDGFMKELDKLGIQLPNELYEELRLDGQLDVGNKLVQWCMGKHQLARVQSL